MRPEQIRIEDYDYPLEEERIAKHPAEVRDECRLLAWNVERGIEEGIFRDLPGMLEEGTVLVYNNTRVINARLRFWKESGAAIEIFCLEPVRPSDYQVNFSTVGECEWLCMVGNVKKWKEGSLKREVRVGDSTVALRAEKMERRGKEWVIRFEWDGDVTFSEIIGAVGEIPVPPYLNRPSEASDSEDYQTVYSHVEGSVAAPTAGLHFTPEVLSEIDARGIERLEVTLHVGAGTFQPVKSESIGEHPMHSEFINVDLETLRKLRSALAEGRKIVAVGTTTVRTLESLYHAGRLIGKGQWEGEVPQWYCYEYDDTTDVVSAIDTVIEYVEREGLDAFVGTTRIIIAPGYVYRLVDGMITNFHQPRSTLLLLVSAFVGEENWRPIYDYALTHGFRFLSYGDACYLRPKISRPSGVRK